MTRSVEGLGIPVIPRPSLILDDAIALRDEAVFDSVLAKLDVAVKHDAGALDWNILELSSSPVWDIGWKVRHAELSRFFGIIIRMMYQDESEHHKPHVHVYYGDFKASIGIDGELLAGSLPAKQYKLVAAWLVLHEDELYKAWNEAVSGRPFDRIKPLS